MPLFADAWSLLGAGERTLLVAEATEQDDACAKADADVPREEAEAEAEADPGGRKLEAAEADDLKKRLSRSDAGMLV